MPSIVVRRRAVGGKVRIGWASVRTHSLLRERSVMAMCSSASVKAVRLWRPFPVPVCYRAHDDMTWQQRHWRW